MSDELPDDLPTRMRSNITGACEYFGVDDALIDGANAIERLRARVAELEKEREVLRADAERLNWLVSRLRPMTLYSILYPHWISAELGYVRAAIDAARAAHGEAK